MLLTSVIGGLLLSLLGAPAGVNMLANPGFEAGWAGWSTGNSWYEAGGQGKGNGISAWSLDEQVAHSGKCSARVQGVRNRGIAMQTLAGYQDRFRVTGWIRTQDLNAGAAQILVEYKDANGGYLGGTPVGQVNGTSDWTCVSGEVTTPAGTRSICVDLLTTAPNDGVAWFDDITCEDITHDAVPPAAVSFQAAPAAAGEIRLRWDPKAAEEDVLRYEIYVSEKPFRGVAGMTPRAVCDKAVGEGSVSGLKDGKRYYARVVAVDQDENRLLEGEPLAVMVKDSLPPRAVKLDAQPVLASRGAVQVRWRPDRRDADIARFIVTAGARHKTVPAGQRELLLANTGVGALRVSVAAVDHAGNRGAESAMAVTVPRAQAGSAAGISGVVTAAGEPLPGAVVTVVDAQGQTRQARCDARGRYVLSLAGRAPALQTLSAAGAGFAESAPVLLLAGAGERRQVNFSLTLPASAVRHWCAGSLANVFPDAAVPAEPSEKLAWLAARGESEGGQIVLRGEQPFTVRGVRFDALRPVKGGAALPASCLRAVLVGTLYVNKNSTMTPPELLLRRAPADFPDPFLEGETRAVPANTAQPVYVLVDVPRGADPGLYQGTARVLIAGEGGEQAQVRVPLSLEVAPVTLPARPTLPVTHWFTADGIAQAHQVALWSESFWELLRVYAQDMAEHRQTMAMAPLDTVIINCDAAGKPVFDFSRFDRWVNIFIAAGVGQRLEIMHFGARENGQWDDRRFTPRSFTATDPRSGQQVPVDAATVAAALQQHLEEKGWLQRAAQHIADEPIDVNVASWRDLSRLVHSGSPRLKRIDAIHVPPKAVQGCLEVMVPQLNFFDQWHDQFMAAKKAGAEVWFYICWQPQGKYPNRLIDYPLSKTRIVPWLTYALGAQGYLHWGYNYWTKDLADMGLAPGDNWIVYPGSDGPRSCLRWETFRDGLEEYELLRMLAAKHPDQAQALASKAVRSATDYEQDPERLEMLHRDLIRALSR